MQHYVPQQFNPNIVNIPVPPSPPVPPIGDEAQFTDGSYVRFTDNSIKEYA